LGGLFVVFVQVLIDFLLHSFHLLLNIGLFYFQDVFNLTLDVSKAALF